MLLGKVGPVSGSESEKCQGLPTTGLSPGLSSGALVRLIVISAILPASQTSNDPADEDR